MLPSAAAFGAFLVGLTARIVGIDAIQAAVSGLTIEIAGDAESRSNTNRSRPSDDRIRELGARVSAALAILKISPDFLITIDAMPPPGARLDLAIVAACMGAVGMIERTTLQRSLFLGELDLRGNLRPVRGVLPILRTARIDRASFKPGNQRADWTFVVPGANADEASRAGAPFVFAVKGVLDLTSAAGFSSGLAALPATPPWKPASTVNVFYGELMGPRVLRILEIVAAGGHGIVFIGSPADCHLAAKTLWSILPPPVENEAVEITEIHSACGLNDFYGIPGGLIAGRPFRAPHHESGMPNPISGRGREALVGGGEYLRPGELSLAHGGMLFLNELPEFRRESVDAIDGALFEGKTTIVRGGATMEFPTRPEIFAVGIPTCFCVASICIGKKTPHDVSCTPERVNAYRARHLDRLTRHLDLFVHLDPIDRTIRTDPARANRMHEETVGRVVAAREFGKKWQMPNPSFEACERVARTLAASRSDAFDSNASDRDAARKLIEWIREPS